MTCVASPRGFSRESADSECRRRKIRYPTRRWRDKSAAIGLAHVVGWIQYFGQDRAMAGWRSVSKHQHIQNFERQPSCFARRLSL